MTHTTCKSIGCSNTAAPGMDFCVPCLHSESESQDSGLITLIDRFPDQYRSVSEMEDIDPHAVLHLFEIPDHSGCLQTAAMKLLMTGTSNTLFRDVKEAKDSLTRWLQLNQELNV